MIKSLLPREGISQDSNGLAKFTNCKGDTDVEGTVCAETKETCDGDPYEFTCEAVGNGLSCNTYAYAVYCDRDCICTEDWEPKQD